MGEHVTKDLYEKTLRYPGHVAAIELLSECGLLSAEEVDAGGVSVKPVRLLQKLLEEKLALGPDGDVLVMRVHVEGTRDGRSVSHEFELVDEVDRERNHTAMGRTTGFTGGLRGARDRGREPCTSAGSRSPRSYSSERATSVW